MALILYSYFDIIAVNFSFYKSSKKLSYEQANISFKAIITLTFILSSPHSYLEYGLCSSIVHINLDDIGFKELKSKLYGDIQKYWTDDKSDR